MNSSSISPGYQPGAQIVQEKSQSEKLSDLCVMIRENKFIIEDSNPYREVFNSTIVDTIGRAIRIIGRDPLLLISGSAILNRQRKAASIRRKHEKDGLIVPPVMIISITSRCNLACSGCYMHGRKSHGMGEMSHEILSSVVNQASDLGVSIIVIAGGEPIVRKDEILDMAKANPRILFPVFTNGMLIDEGVAADIASCRNIVPVISFEGFGENTDARRGEGVYDRLLKACRLLKNHGVFFGCSVTTTRNNFNDVTSEAFIRQMIDVGARVFTFVEFVPMSEDTEDHILTQVQKRELQIIISDYNLKFKALFIGFPGDEAYYGGCLAAGRGFVHVSPSGDLEPCPAAPYSDANLAVMPLKEALKSGLLDRIRDVPELLNESAGGCALRKNRVLIEEIIGG